MWFFALADCDRISNSDTFKDNKLEVQIEAMRAGSHFSYEESSSLFWHMASFIVFLLVMGTNVYYFVKDILVSEKADRPLLFVTCAVSMQIMGILLQIIHLTFFSSNGEGLFVLRAFSVVLQLMAQVIIAFLVCMVAWGWQIKFESLDWD